MSKPEQILSAAVEQFVGTHEELAGDESRATIGEYVGDLEALIEAFGTDDIPLHWAACAAAVDDLSRHWATYLAAYEANERLTVLPAGFQSAIANVEVEAQRARKYIPRTVEPMKTLTHPQSTITLQQIARMHDWMTPDGAPDVHKVQDEIDHPGTHRGPDWLPETELQLRRQWQRLLDVRSDQRAAARQAAEDAYETAHREAPESIEELIKQGLTVPQIFKVKPSATLEDIMAAGARLGTFPASTGENLSATRAPRASERQAIEDAKEEAVARHHTEVMADEMIDQLPEGETETLESLILEAAAELPPDSLPSVIAEHVGKYGGKRVRAKDVKEVLERLEPVKPNA